MSQVITNAFEQYWQSSLAAEQPVVLDEFILADIPNLDITSPIDPDTGLPPESQIVHRQNVDQRGRINNNAVAYTIVMDTTVGDFSFNAMYLRNKQNGVIGMIVYKGRETKLKTDQTTGQTGNSLVKSMLMGYDQAAEATLTNVDAGTWQIDYAARLRGQDEDLRQLASQLYGHHTFIGDGFKVVQQDGGHQVTQGVAIVGGLRIELKQPEVIYPGTKPIGVWVDVHRSGSLLSEHQNHFTIITSVADLTDHVDGNGYPHYVAKLGTVQADNTVTDGRGQGGSSSSGSIPDTFALWKRSMAEAGYDLIGQFGSKLTIQNAKQVVLSKDGTEVYGWLGGLPKDVPADATLESTGGIVASAWVDRSTSLLSNQVAKSITSAEFSGGADPTGAAPSDAAFAAASAYTGAVRVEGNFTLTNVVTRTNSVMELPPGSTITKNKLAGPSTENGANIPSKTMFGRLVIRDEDVVPSGSDSFTTYPDMGQALRIDSKQVRGQCGMFLGGDKKNPVISRTDYVGLHTRHDQSLVTPKVWGYNPVVVKNIATAEAEDSLVLGAEISLSNNTPEAGLPQRAGALEGLFISYIHTANNASAAMSTGGLTAGFNNALWLDGVNEKGVHISLRDEVSANSGVKRGLDTTGVSAFSEGAVLLGRGHGINSVDTGGAIRPLLYINSANEVVHGQQAVASRFLGPVSQFDGHIRPTTNETFDCGSTVLRWKTGFFGTSVVTTSDENAKQDIGLVDDALLDAWADVDWYSYQFINAVVLKGEDGARWHFGLVAQRVKAVLDRHGINGFNFGLLCYDKWDDQYEQYQINEGETVIKTKTVTVPKKISKTVIEKKLIQNESGQMVLTDVEVVKEEPVLVQEYVYYEDGNPVLAEDGTRKFLFTQVTEEVVLNFEAPAEPIYGQRVVRKAGELYGIRYEEALSLEAALQRRNYQRLLNRIEALEAN
ncbi:phage tail-collar fiber domain-containing protein [Aeromonas taiwanensis]